LIEAKAPLYIRFGFFCREYWREEIPQIFCDCEFVGYFGIVRWRRLQCAFYSGGYIANYNSD
jgi:hypothetical protein